MKALKRYFYLRPFVSQYFVKWTLAVFFSLLFQSNPASFVTVRVYIEELSVGDKWDVH